MAVDVTIDGTLYTSTSSYTVQEDATPIVAGDNAGGTGQFTITLPTPEDASKARRFRDKSVSLADGSQGTTVGIARQISGNDLETTITADSRLAALVVTRTTQPYVGTLEGAFRYYLSLCEVTTGIFVDASIASIPVTILGWNGSVWDGVKRLCAAYRVEVSLVSDNIVMRPIRTRTAINYRDSSRSWSFDATGMAQAIEIYYYQSQQKTGALAYPLGGWTADVTSFTVNAGETQTATIPLYPESDGEGIVASLASVQQPTAVDSVSKEYAASSVYSIVGKDQLPYLAAQWNAGGGSISVVIGDDTRSLVLTITAPAETQYAPYTIAMSSGASNNYSSLRIVGNGVFGDRKILNLKTGVSADRAPTEVATLIDNENILTEAQAWAAGIEALGMFSSARHSISVTTTGINRTSDNGSYRFPTMGDANDEYSPKTFAQMNTLYAGKTMGEVTAIEKARKSADFANQAFGNVSGARVFLDNSVFRIRSAPQIGPDALQYTAERDVTAADINAALAGKSFAEVNAIFASNTMGDYNAMPLRSS